MPARFTVSWTNGTNGRGKIEITEHCCIPCGREDPLVPWRMLFDILSVWLKRKGRETPQFTGLSSFDLVDRYQATDASRKLFSFLPMHLLLPLCIRCIRSSDADTNASLARKWAA